jgi:hypothetical protein
VRVAYIANVGARDVLVKGEPLTSPRPDGEALLAQVDARRADLSAPILERGIDHVLARTERIEQMVLFASDQPHASTDEIHWNRDTIALGRILQRLLKDEYSERVGRIDCCSMPCNPADYDQTYKFFKDQLPRQVPPASIEAVWIAPVGGAPASNTGLLLNAVRIYREPCQLIYVLERGRVQTLDLHEEILAHYAREEAKAHLERRDFAALREALMRHHLGRPWHQSLW